MFPGRERRQNRRTDRRTDRQERLVGGTNSRSPVTTKGRSTAARETTATATVNDEGLSFDEQAEQAIPADVRMISGCHDVQTSADVSNVSDFSLPDPAGRAGGACTSALLQVIYNQHDLDPTYHNLSFMDVFLQTRDVIEGMGYQQVPQLSSSRRIDIHQPFNMMKNDTSGGTRYAVLIGINYTSHKQGQLSGCHNDVGNIKKYIMDVGKIKARNITTLMDDDGISIPPTKRNIMKAFDELTRKCQPGDCAFVHYSGHGSRQKDHTGQEESGYNSTLVPIDFNEAGQIVDDELYEHLVLKMPRGSTLTCLMDCCHSGTVLDLPFNFVADGEQTEMVEMENFPFLQLLQCVGKALQDAGVSQLRDLRDKDKREQVKAALVENGVGEQLAAAAAGAAANAGGAGYSDDDDDGGQRGLVAGGTVRDNIKSRQERRENRRKFLR